MARPREPPRSPLHQQERRLELRRALVGARHSGRVTVPGDRPREAAVPAVQRVQNGEAGELLRGNVIYQLICEKFALGKFFFSPLHFSYNIMIHCWSFSPDRRPSFNELIEWFESLLQHNTDYLDLNPLMVHNATYLQPIRQGKVCVIVAT